MSVEAENETDAEREQTYKRGYTHGVMKTVSALVHKLGSGDKERIDAWVKDLLMQWEQDATPSVHAPKFPAL